MNIENIQKTPQFELKNDIIELVCDKFDFFSPPFDPVEFSNSLTLFREERKGLGLAANQVGIPYRIASIKGIDSCLFNPKIVYSSVETTLHEEGCLSFPGLIVKIKRPEYIRVRYTDALNQTKIKTYHGMTARVICHEIDHLDGVLFYNKANKFHKDQAFRQWNRLKKNKIQNQKESLTGYLLGSYS